MNKRPNEIYTDRARLLEAIEEARKPGDDVNFKGINKGYQRLEDDLGLYRYSLKRALKGTGNLTVHTLIKLADYTGVSIDYLLGLSDRKFLTGREPRGHWIFDESGQAACSNCHNILLRKRNENVDMRYCPNCGADMKGGAK